MDSNFVGPRRQSEGLWSWNLVSNRFHFSPGWIRLVGCEEHEVGNTRQAWLQRVHPEDIDQVSSALDACLADGSAEFELRHRMLHKDGSYRWTSCRGVVQRNAGGQAVQVDASHSDVTADTVSDPLTGLPNRLLLVEHLTRSIERANRYPGFHFAVLRIDLGRPLDAEALGTRVGPALACRGPAAGNLAACPGSPAQLRNHDLVARLQDDQFAILLDGLKEVGHATVAAERILAEIQAPFTLGGRELRLSAEHRDRHQCDRLYHRAEDVLRDADTALHRATLLGRSRCEVFDTAVLKSAQTELQLEADFAGALDRGEFLRPLPANRVAHVQSDRRIRSLGAMAAPGPRPDSAAGVHSHCGEDRIHRARLAAGYCAKRASSSKPGRTPLPSATELWMSVNLSGVQLRHPALLDEIAEVLHDSGLDARCLVLELTEGIALENPAAVRTLLMQLRAAGCPNQRGRFRHRILLAGISAPVAAGLAQGRPGFRPRHRSQHGHGEYSHRHHRHGAPTRTAGGCRGNRERRATGAGSLAGLRVWAGLPVFAAARPRWNRSTAEDRTPAVAGRCGWARRCDGASVRWAEREARRPMALPEDEMGVRSGSGPGGGGVGRRSPLFPPGAVLGAARLAASSRERQIASPNAQER